MAASADEDGGDRQKASQEKFASCIHKVSIGVEITISVDLQV